MDIEASLQSLTAFLTWIGGGFLVVLATLKIGDLVVKFFERVWRKKDDHLNITIANEGKKIEADSQFIETLMKRIVAVETENREIRGDLKLMHKDMLNQAVSSAKIETENANLKLDNQKKDAEIIELRRDSALQDREISDLREQLRVTELQVKELMTRVEQFERK